MRREAMKCGLPRPARLWPVLAGVLAAALPGAAQALETRTVVIGWLSQATLSGEDDCPKGVNPVIGDQYLLNLRQLGYSGEEVEELARKSQEGASPDPVFEIARMRGRVNGAPTNPYVYPETAADPNLNALEGRVAYGFDLDGKGPDQASGFQDPDTLQRGVDNEMYRALGCMRSFRGSLAGRPTYWAWAWGQVRDSQPAWVVQVSGEDLSRDGPVTVTIDRALEYVRSNADGSPKSHATYRIDPDPRSHNVFKGVLKDGTVTVDTPTDFRILQNPLVAPELILDRAQLRLTLDGEGGATGMIGGYQPWKDLYWGMASGAPGVEVCITGDLVGIYYLLKTHADFDPDETGQNQKISTTYYFEGVPAFVVPAAQRTAGK